MKQSNTTPEAGHEAKYEVGAVLRFVEYNGEELAATPDYSQPFRRDDLLWVRERNCCGMGIDVVRVADGVADMVWPEEVEVEAGAGRGAA